MLIQGYCLESTADCAVMASSSLLVAFDILRLFVQLILTAKTKCSNKHIQKGKYQKCQFNLKILFILAMLGVSVGQILVWILIEKSMQSYILLQVFALNSLACCIWICALIQDKNRQGHTRLRTIANMSINLISNVLIALLTSRNTLDSKDDLSFYLYIGYIGCIGVMQIFFYQRAKDYEAVSIDELNENTSNENNSAIQNKSTAPFETESMNEMLIDKMKQEDNIGEKTLKKIEQQTENKEISNLPQILNSVGNPVMAEKQETQKCSESQKLNEKINNKPLSVKEYFQDVRIDKFVEMIKYQKKTIMFESKFTYQGQIRLVKHSFREFIQLRNSIKSSHPNLELPPFPTKKDQNTILTFVDLEERRKLLSAYLQALCKEVEAPYLTQFFLPPASATAELKPPGSPKKRSGSKKNCIDDSRNQGPQTAPIPDTIWEEDEELSISSSK